MLFGSALRRRPLLVALVAFVAALVASGLAAPAPTSAAARPLERVVVLSSADVADAAAALARAGGHVVDELPLIGAVVAELPRGAALPSGYTVVPDRPLQLTADSVDTSGPASTVRGTLGLPATGTDGAGVGVALVDTGVADVPGLAGQVVRQIDVADHERGDGYGHGTFLAGVIAGTDDVAPGVAPGAHLLDVRVAEADGTTSLIDVLRGLQAVARYGPRYDVRVVNLALSSDSPLPYKHDPLTRALEALWRMGYVVVVPAGNDGPAPGSVASPGIDPTLLTVGALDENGTAAHADDALAEWSGRGPTRSGDEKPDVAAPGVHLLSLRAPGSLIDENNPQARVGERYFRGSGTSMSAAVVSGAAAAVLAANPRLRPDDVKALLSRTAYDLPAARAGGLDVAAALTAADQLTTHGHRPHGHGKADRHRGSDAHAWSSRAWSSRAWSSRAWSSRAWSSRAWSSRAWSSRAWSSRAWSTADWG